MMLAAAAAVYCWAGIGDAHAQYTRGNSTCNNFSYWLEQYNTYNNSLAGTVVDKHGNVHISDSLYVTPQEFRVRSFDSAINFAFCLLVGGHSFAKSTTETVSGGTILQYLADQGHVPALFLRAHLIETGGTFERLDLHISDIAYDHPNSLENAEAAWGRTLAKIKAGGHPNPEWGHEWYESNWNIELESYRRYAASWWTQFHYQVHAQERQWLASSPSYTGNRNSWYFRPNDYALDSLNKARAAFQDCARLENKSHFNGSYYQRVVEICRTYADKASALEPLMREWRGYMFDTSCRSDLPQCDEFQELKNRMAAIAPELGGEIM